MIPTAQIFRVNTNPDGPILQYHRLAIDSYSKISSEVPALLKMRTPHAIAWLVISVIIDTLQFFTVRTLAHIGQEVFKVPPALADFNSPEPIIGKYRRLGI